MTRLIKQFSLLPLIGAALVLAGCGGSSPTATSDQSAEAGGGSVGILLTDKPADPALFSAINATIARIELIGGADDSDPEAVADAQDDSDNKVVIYDDAPKTVDLLRLKHEAIPFSFRDDVPTGRYCKIRLILDDLELVLADDTPADDSDNDTYHPHLPGNGKLDLVARDCFHVVAGEVVTLQLDLDAGNSIHIVQRGNRDEFNFRPVAFIDVVNQGFDGKLVRLNGEIDAVNTEANSLRLCGALPLFQSEQKRCARIMLGDAAAFFDNQQHNGMPRPLDELLSASRVGESITVVGWPRQPAAQQLLSDDHAPLLTVEALVVELGEFLSLAGEVAVDADADGFEATLNAGPVAPDGDLTVALQAGAPGVNGTRIVSKSGQLLDHSAIVVPRTVTMDGVLQLADDVLQAALVIVDTAPLSGAQQITGTILTTNSGGFTLSPQGAACGFSGDLVVTTDEDTAILTVTVDDSGSEVAPGGEIAAGQEIGLGGVCDGSGYAAHTVVILDDQRG